MRTLITQQARALDKKEKYQYTDYHDPDYFGIRDIENMLGNIDGADYYKPILAKESFKGNCQYYQIRGDRDNKLSLKQYLCKITPELVELINEKKTTTA